MASISNKIKVTIITHSTLKCIWNEKQVDFIWRAFQNGEEWCFPFRVILYALERFTILYYADKIIDDITMFSQRKAKTQNEEYLWK